MVQLWMTAGVYSNSRRMLNTSPKLGQHHLPLHCRALLGPRKMTGLLRKVGARSAPQGFWRREAPFGKLWARPTINVAIKGAPTTCRAALRAANNLGACSVRPPRAEDLSPCTDPKRARQCSDRWWCPNLGDVSQLKWCLLCFTTESGCRSKLYQLKSSCPNLSEGLSSMTR